MRDRIVILWVVAGVMAALIGHNAHPEPIEHSTGVGHGAHAGHGHHPPHGHHAPHDHHAPRDRASPHDNDAIGCLHWGESTDEHQHGCCTAGQGSHLLASGITTRGPASGPDCSFANVAERPPLLALVRSPIGILRPQDCTGPPADLLQIRTIVLRL